MTTLLKQLGYNASLARNQAGLTQVELAEICGVHPTEISRIENGKRNMQLESVERLAKGLEIDVAQLFGAAGALDYPAEPEAPEESGEADAGDA